MDSTIIKYLSNYNDNNLETIIYSDRFIYKDIDEKISHFLKKGGLNIILITGLRGVGKTTILKSIAKKFNGLYTSGDFLKTRNITLNNLVNYSKTFSKDIVIIDEVLYLSDWQINLKIEADTNQNKLFIISGSSAMQLKKISQDLSRRLDTYKLHPLSFKEFLKIKHNISLDVLINFKELLIKDKNKVFLNLFSIKQKLPKNIFLLYKEYLENQFPFLLEEKNKKYKLKELIEKVIYKDMPQIDNIYSDQLKNAEIIIKFISSAEKINYTNIANNLGLKKDMVIKLIDLLEKAELLYFVQDIVATRELRSNKKILFASPELRSSLNDINQDRIIGFSREDSFGLVLKSNGIDFAYNYKQDGYDYLVLNQKFEIGNNKTNISKDVIVVSDSLDVDYKDGVLVIPLYMFSLIER